VLPHDTGSAAPGLPVIAFDERTRRPVAGQVGDGPPLTRQRRFYPAGRQARLTAIWRNQVFRSRHALLPLAWLLPPSRGPLPNTALKAYRDLERESLVRPRPGQGTFITRSLPRTDPAAQSRFLGSMTDWLRSARAAGLGPDEIEAIYRTAFRNWRPIDKRFFYVKTDFRNERRRLPRPDRAG
jgi:hypothetical protein